MSLLIKNGKIYQNKSLVAKNIFIKEDKITKISNQEIQADETIDAKDKIIIPGLVDSHVHFREPGMTEKEDFLSGSMAAAAGGVTTIIDMPNTIPPTDNLQRLEEKRNLAKKSVVNFGFHFGSSKDNISEIKKAERVASVKIYMDHTTGDLKLENKNILEKIFTSNKTIAVHAEGENVKIAKELIQLSDNILYICHVSSKQDLDEAKKEIKNKVYVEVCPHHLFLTKENLNELQNFGEMKPDLKTKEDQDSLWEGIKNGLVDTIATDHAPHTKENKLQLNYPYGVPGCETMLPLLLNDERIDINTIVKLCCENPVKIFKIKNKGFIKEGFDADLTIIDQELEKEVKDEELFTKCKWSPFNGWKLKGWPITTIVNGKVIFDGKINNIPGKEVEYNE